jgi:hypothetical protein
MRHFFQGFQEVDCEDFAKGTEEGNILVGNLV